MLTVLPGSAPASSRSKPAGAAGDRAARRGLIGQRARHRGGELVDLVLRLHQNVVAQLQVGRDLAGRHHVVGDDVDLRAVRELDVERADAGLGRVDVVERRCRQRAGGGKGEFRGEPGADQLDAGRGVDVGLVRIVGGDADVDIFRQRVDGLVALVHQRCGRGIVGRQALEPGVDVGDLLHGRIGGLRRIAEILFDVGAQRLNALGGDVELRRERLGRPERNGLRRRRTRAGRQRLQRRGELVQRAFERAGIAGRAVDILKLLQDVGHLVGVAAAAGLGP
ncbi:hypothetical protein ABIA09_007315 [Bradyrhizobium yuanmingense]